MKALGLIAAAVLLGTACATARGTGGSGIDLDEAHQSCLNAAKARGWEISKLEKAEITSRTHARLVYDRSGFLKPDATCFFDARTNAASID